MARRELAEVLSGSAGPATAAFGIGDRISTGATPHVYPPAPASRMCPAIGLTRGVDRQSTIAANILMGSQNTPPW